MGRNGEIDRVVEEFSDAFAGLDTVTAVSMGGSVSRGMADENSDLEVYVYSEEEVLPREKRDEVILSMGGEELFHWNSDVWGEYTFFENDGVKVDSAYRDLLKTEDDLEEFLAGDMEDPEPEIEYTAFGHYHSGVASDIQDSTVLYDRDGSLEELKEELSGYPEELRERRVERYLSSARKMLDKRVSKGVERDDFLLYDSASSRVLRSLTVALFALNRTYYPGDKWNGEYLREFDRMPDGLMNDIQEYRELPDTPEGMDAGREVLERMVTGVEERAAEELD